MSNQPKVLHVSQASSGGVLNALVQLANSQSSDGTDVIVLYGRRPDTPSLDELRRLFAPGVELLEAPGRGMGAVAAAKLFIATFRTIQKNAPNYIHLHSSFAGAVGRFAALCAMRQSSTFYSPHGFSFLRQDAAHWKRTIFTAVERICHLTGSSMVLVSNSEREAAKRVLSSKRLYVLENGIDTGALPERATASERLLVGSAGRVTYAKAPWNFSAMAASLSSEAEFIWVGGGDTGEVNRWLDPNSVEITGWLPEETAVRRIAGLDIYVSTSLWEGLPVAVIQAQALGIPCVVSGCVGNIDVVEHGVTGYVAKEVEELADRVLQLVNDPELRYRLGENARRLAIPRFDSKRLGPASFQIYNATASLPR